MRLNVSLLVAWLLVPCAVWAAESKVAILDGMFADPSRSREIPYRIYHPEPLEGRYPVIIFSHGLGGSREGNAEFGRGLAARGYICVHIQHSGTDREVYAGATSRRAAQAALGKAERTRMNALQRFLDVPFVVRQLPRLDAQDGVLAGHLDLVALGMAGHSYGAISTLVAAGQGVGPNSRSFKVAGLRAAVALSPSPPNSEQTPDGAYGNVDIPVFHMTGTKDASPAALTDRDVEPADRLEPYAGMKHSDQYLLVLADADHETFSGKRIADGHAKRLDRQHMDAIINGAALFFDAYLKGEETQKTSLRTEYGKSLGQKDRFEFKAPPPPSAASDAHANP
jgi:dienelactone hydrolase